MPVSTWAEWVVHHRTIFALTAAEDMAMLGEWAKLFELAGWTPAQLVEATDWLALNAPPRYRTEHLAALQVRVRQQRGAGQARPEEDPRGTCGTCGGAGLVSVPLVPGMRTVAGNVVPDDGVWRTCAVLCRCALGRWTAEHMRGEMPDGSRRPPLMTLDAYSAVVPCWRDLIDRHEEFLRAHRETRIHTGAIDDALGQIRVRVRKSEAS